MKPKKRYRNDKYIWDVKNYFKRYFRKKTCRKIKRINVIEENIKENGGLMSYEFEFGLFG